MYSAKPETIQGRMLGDILCSVCICTYNRAISLHSTLETLSRQSNLAWSKVEVLIIDNRCTDNTAEVCGKFADKIPLRRIYEPAQGLSHARNRAVAEARGDWIVFTDDDVRLEPNWLSAYQKAFSVFADAEFAGGRILPYWENNPPHWFKAERLSLLDGLLVWYELDGKNRMFTESDPLPFGASFAFKKTLAQRLGPFSTELGVKGKANGRGEETEFLSRATALGAKGVYVHDATAHHVADPDRFAIFRIYRHGVAVGRAHRLMTNPHAQGSTWRAILFLLRGLRQAARGRGDRFRQCIINAGIQRGMIGKPYGLDDH